MKTPERPRQNVLLNLACLVVVVAGLKASASVLLPFLLSILLAVLAMPVVRWLKGMRVPAPMAVLMTVGLLIGLFAGAGVVVGTSVNDFSEDRQKYEEGVKRKFAEMRQRFAGDGEGAVEDEAPAFEEADASVETGEEVAGGEAVEGEEVIEDEASAGGEASISDVGSWLDPGAAFAFAGKLINGFVGMLSNLFLILLTTVFILLEGAGIPAKLRAAFPGDGAPLSKATAVGRSVQAYLGVKTLMSFSTAVCVTVLVSALGLSHAVLWGLVAFLLNFVPSIGSIIAALPVVLLALVEDGTGTALGVLAGYVAINMIIGNVIEPRLMGRRLGLSPLVVFLSLLFWGWVWGPAGMLLSVPLTVMVKIILEGRDETRWIGVLLGPEAEARGTGSP